MRAVTLIIPITLTLALVACGGKPPKTGSRNPAGKWVFTNPMAETEVGEWCRYRLSDEDNANTMLLEVMETRDEKGQRPVVFVKTEIRGGDVERPMHRTTQRIDRNHFLNGYRSAGWIVMRMYPDEIVLGSRRFKCMCVEYLTRLSGNVKVWYSHEIPVWGMLRQVRVAPDMKETINAELVDWSGRSEE